MSIVKVLVVADRSVIADGIAAAIESGIDGAQAVGVTDGGGRFMEHVDLVVPAVVVLDLDLRADAYRRVAAQVWSRGLPTVCVVGDSDDALELVQAPVDGIVTPRAGLRGVVHAVRALLEGHAYIAPDLLADVLRGLVGQTKPATAPGDGLRNLTGREREVLSLLGDGRDVADIARSLCISPETAKTHIRHVLHKLGVRSRVQAAAIAADAGLLTQGARG